MSFDGDENEAEESESQPQQRRNYSYFGGCRVLEIMKDALASVALVILALVVTQGQNVVQPSTPTTATTPSRLRTRSSPDPVPLFGGLFVDDYYSGDVFAAFAEADLHESALIMFYAPWDADCQRAASVLEAVARAVSDTSDLYVAAVNCWEPRGDCHREFGDSNKNRNRNSGWNPRAAIQQYPVFVFYPKQRKGVQYNGPIAIQSILEFILAAKNPMRHIWDKTELVKLRGGHGGKALVGYFPGLAGHLSKSFRHFLDTAYRLLELDPFQRHFGGIGVVTSKRVAFHLQLDSSRTVRYFHWNGTNVAYPNKTVTPALVDWVKSQGGNDLTAWVGTAGRKSISLANRLQAGSGYSLLAFVPRTHRRAYNAAMGILQESALKYKTCGDRDDANGMLSMMRETRRQLLVDRETLLGKCLGDVWFVRNFGQEFAENHAKNICSSCGVGNAANWTVATLGRNSHGTFHRYQYTRTPPPGSPQKDVQVQKMLQKDFRLDCSLLFTTAVNGDCNLFDGDVEDVFQETDMDSGVSDQLWGLGCEDNKTLNVYTLDTVTQWALAEKLGLDFETTHPGVLIVDHKGETYYEMPGNLSPQNVADFITTFHKDPGTLTMKKLSQDPPAIPCHLPTAPNQPCIQEINRDTFYPNLLAPNREKPVVLLYHTPTCVFCSVASHVFHTVREVVLQQDEIVTFLTVDASSNDLPWSYTALSVPSILFFGPSGLKETRAFPANKPLNVPNLLSFIIANLKPEERLRLAVSLCDEDCMEEVRVETLRHSFLEEDREGNHGRPDSPEIKALLDQLTAQKQSDINLRHGEL